MLHSINSPALRPLFFYFAQIFHSIVLFEYTTLSTYIVQKMKTFNILDVMQICSIVLLIVFAKQIIELTNTIETFIKNSLITQDRDRETDINFKQKLMEENSHTIREMRNIITQHEEKIQDLLLMNRKQADELHTIADKVTILRKFPSIKTIDSFSIDVATETIGFMPNSTASFHSSIPHQFITFFDITTGNALIYGLEQSFQFQYKKFIESMYNLKTVQICYFTNRANLFLNALEIINTNNVVLDLLHITNSLDRDMSDILVLFKNYKVLRITHTIDFNDLVVHCRENNITYINDNII